jgi:hypothetical protein
MMRLLICSALVFVSVSAASQSKDDRTDSDPNKLICRSEEVAGTGLQAQRTCLMRQQWAQRREEMPRTVQRIQDFKSSQY